MYYYLLLNNWINLLKKKEEELLYLSRGPFLFLEIFSTLLTFWSFWPSFHHHRWSLRVFPCRRLRSEEEKEETAIEMALLGDDGKGYELARKLESCGVWRAWLGDSLYSGFAHFLSSSSSWESFMRVDDSKSRAQIQLQLRARALLFDKATVSLFLRSNHNPNPSTSSSFSASCSLAVSRLNNNCE